MRVKKTPAKFVHCVVCNVDLNNLTMYHRHIATYGHQLEARENDTFKTWLQMHKERVLIITGNFRLIPTPGQELAQIPILKAFDLFLKNCNASVDDMMWSNVQSGYLLMRNQQAVEEVGSIYTGVGRWGRRILLDEKNWIEVKAAGTIAADVWQEMVADSLAD